MGTRSWAGKAVRQTKSSISVLVALVVFGVAPVTAGTVSNDEFNSANPWLAWRSARGPAVAAATLPHSSQRTAFKVELDLTGYKNAAVMFDFDAFVARNSDGFTRVRNSGLGDADGFTLSDPLSGGPPGTSGFYRPGTGGPFNAAMFNLSSFDGRLVTLRIAFDSDTSSRRSSGINVDNISVHVSAAAAAAAETTRQIPEPSSIALVLLALGVSGFARCPRRFLLGRTTA